jgi:hypothetical protein
MKGNVSVLGFFFVCVCGGICFCFFSTQGFSV